MTQERQFINEGKRRMLIEEFLASEFSRAGYSHAEIQRTPLSIRITVFAHKPGLIIGRGGKNIDAITQVLKERFGLENPQLDVQEVMDSDLDSEIVAKQIVAALEKGVNYKRVANFALERVIGAGAVGIAIRISGKIGGDMARTEKFSSGYLKYSGEPAERLVQKAYATANVKLGTIGVQVRILRETPEDIKVVKKLKELGK
jgi:small subunit ribosomal protein S3